MTDATHPEHALLPSDRRALARLDLALLRYGAMRPWRWVDVERPIAISVPRAGITLGAIVLASSPEGDPDAPKPVWFFPDCDAEPAWRAICAAVRTPAERAAFLGPCPCRQGWLAGWVGPDGRASALTAAELRVLCAVLDATTMFLASRGPRVRRTRPCSARLSLPDHWDVGTVKVLTPHPTWRWPSTGAGR